MTKMKYCPNCNSLDFDEESMYCANCGYNLSDKPRGSNNQPVIKKLKKTNQNFFF